MLGRQPSPILGDTDGHNFILILIDGLENRGGREQRPAAAAAEVTDKFASNSGRSVCSTISEAESAIWSPAAVGVRQMSA